MFEVGDVVGSYTILAHLRTGGMADLFLARREGAAGFRRLVAVKVVHPRLAEDAQLVRMFLDEALITARIDHPNVVHVEDLGEFDETYFLVMEYVHGCSLAQLMQVLGQLHRRLSPLVAVAVAARIAEGLHAAHETTDDEGNLVGLVHRDVSPQNILLSHKGHVKLIDFGVAKARLRSEETQTAMLKGKVRYMAPEQATTGVVDRRSDVYSLGIVLWEMLTMRRLFAGKTEFEVLMNVRDPTIVAPSTYVPDLPEAVDEVVLCALETDPDRRPASAKTLRRMLAAALPRSMALDSAHLADLMASVVGEELEKVRHELPDEVSRLLEGESLRALEEDRQEPSAVDVMTVHSDMVSFEEDELDDTPEVTDVIRQSRPDESVGPPSVEVADLDGAPTVEAPSVSIPNVDTSSPEHVFAAPTELDDEPTVVGGVPDDISDRLTSPDEEPEDQTEQHNTRPDDTANEIPEPAWEQAPTVAVTGPGPVTGQAPLPLGAKKGLPTIVWVLAVVASVFVGLALALAYPVGRWLLADDEPPALVRNPPPVPDAGAPDAGPPPDAGAPDAGPGRRGRRARRRRGR